MLIGIHTALAAISGEGKWLLDKEEAEQLAKATADVAKHYSVRGIDEKTQDWMQLIFVICTIYGVRLYIIASEKRAARPMKNVTPPAPPQPSPMNAPQKPEAPKGDSEIPGLGKINMEGFIP